MNTLQQVAEVVAKANHHCPICGGELIEITYTNDDIDDIDGYERCEKCGKEVF